MTGVEQGTPSVNPPPAGQYTHHLGGGATSTNFGGLTPNQTYSMIVYAYNGQGCRASTEVPVTPRAAPGTVSARVDVRPDPDRPGHLGLPARRVHDRLRLHRRRHASSTA